jgi:hypothetical protein
MPTPEDVIDGVQAIAAKTFGMKPTVPHPHLALQPISHFLPAGVSIR